MLLGGVCCKYSLAGTMRSCRYTGIVWDLKVPPQKQLERAQQARRSSSALEGL